MHANEGDVNQVLNQQQQVSVIAESHIMDVI